jgi:hypothetical protein
MKFSEQFYDWVVKGCVGFNQQIEKEFVLFLLNQNPEEFLNLNVLDGETPRKRRFYV